MYDNEQEHMGGMEEQQPVEPMEEAKAQETPQEVPEDTPNAVSTPAEQPTAAAAEVARPVDSPVNPFSNIRPYGDCCPHCGGEWQISPPHGGVGEWKCRSCGFHKLVKKDELEELFACSKFSDNVVSILYNRGGRKRADRIQRWKDQKNKFRNELENYTGTLCDDPLYGMALAAYLTYGFEGYPSSADKETVETLYRDATGYLQLHPKASRVKKLLQLYRRKMKNKARNRALIAATAVVGCVAAFLVALGLYTPTPKDPASGIEISVPNDAISLFDKFAVKVDAELHPTNSAVYIDAKNALRNESEKFVLYDLSLVNGNRPQSFNGSVKVTVPIPSGYQTECLKVYHVLSDESYEEVPSTVSVADNTISFETTHFSLYAIAERHPIVIFDSVGGSEVDRQIVQRDSLAAKPLDPEKVGYRFGGWWNGEEAWSFDSDTVMKDVVLTAKWIPITYQVNLDLGGGICNVTSLSLPFMGTYQGLPTVSKLGYTFVGWFDAPVNGTQVDSDTVMQRAENHTLYAIFEINRNKVIFDANEGSGTMADFYLPTGSEEKLPENRFKRTGWTFIGWSTTSGGEVEYEDKALYSMGTESTYTLYAKWKINTGTLLFDKNGGEGEMAPLSMEYGTTQRLPANTFTRPGYSFVGWSTTPGGSVSYTDRVDYTMGEKAEYVLYAQWKKNSYKLFFDANKGSGVMSFKELEFDEYISLPLCAFTREGYRFIGWATEADGAPIYTDGATFCIGDAGDVTLYACWQGEGNSFTFYANFGEGNMRSDFTIETGESGALPKNQFTRNGYTFLGWSTDPYGSVQYTDEDIYYMNESGDVNLYAVWEAIDYTIQYNTNGGTAIADGKFNAKTVVTLPTDLTKKGYTFDGWYASNDFSGDRIENIPLDSYGDKTFYAKWTPVVYNIGFDSDGGSNIASITYTIESENFALPTPSKTGYDFGGWLDKNKPTDEAVFVIRKGSTENRNYYAKWIPIEYKITFNSNGGSAIDEKKYTIETETFTLPTPTKTGYTFGGWYTASNFSGTRVESVALGSMDDKTLYAKWDLIEYTITYHSNGGNEIADKEYTIETLTFSLPTPEKRGYTFLGWFDNISCEGSAVASVELGSTGVKDFYAKWKATVYEVTFAPNGGNTVIDPITYTVESEEITLSQTCTREGYTFLGWYRNADGTGEKVLTIETGSVDNMTLYAGWAPVEYTISFITGGGDAVDPMKFTVESANTLLPQTCIRTGYTFVGWYSNADYTGTPVSFVAGGSMGEKVFYAKWDPIKYTVTFESNGGSAVALITYTIESADIDLSQYQPSKTGYHFLNWCDEDGSSISVIRKGSVGDRVLSAVWSDSIPYTIKLHQNNGNGILTINYNINSETVVLPTDLIYSGYTFVGWYADEACEGTAVTEVASGSTGDRVYYAKWTRDSYTVSFEANGGSAVGEMTYHVETATFALPTPTKTGYTFGGWYENASLGGAKLEYIELGSTGNKLLYAKWEVVPYTVTYDSNGGSNVADREYTIETETFALPTPTKTGYTFGGWYENADFSGVRVERIELGSTGNKVFYAKWELVPYTVTFESNGGSTIEEKEYTIESATFNLPVPTKTGYTFGGWYTASDFSGASVESIAIGSMGNKQLYAKWELIEYTIRFETNGGSAIDSITYTVESEDIDLSQYQTSKMGYHFLNWCDEDGNSISTIRKGSVGDRVLSAAWSDSIPYTITLHQNNGNAVLTINYNINSETYILPTDLIYKGYTFDGWYAASDFSGARVESVASGSTGDLVYYAKWTRDSYTITFESNGGSAVDSQSYHVETPTFTLPVPTKTGYAFGGWYENADFSGTKIERVVLGSTGNKELYAKWELIEYTITFGGGEIDPITYTVEDLPITLPTPTKNGYTFGGWYENADFSGVRVERIELGSIGNKVFYPKWELVPYTVTFIIAGGNVIDPITYTVESATIDLTRAEYQAVYWGYAFLGWYNNPEFMGSQVTVIAKGSTGDLILYAKKADTPTEYSIDFYSNNGTTIDSITYTVESAKITLPTPTKEGYIFGGWYDNPNFTGTVYTELKKGAYAQDFEFHAKWNGPITITFDLNSGKVAGTPEISQNSQSVVYGAFVDVQLPVPSCEYYVFTGWFTSADGGEQITDNNGNMLSGLTDNTTLYAHWVQDYSDYTYISKATDLEQLRLDLTGKYLLLNDIDCSGMTWSTVGSSSAKFSGILEGNGHTISNLTGETLISYNTGTIKNLTLTGANISANSAEPRLIGILTGSNEGTIDNCHITFSNVSAYYSYNSGDCRLFVAGFAAGLEPTGIVSNSTISYTGLSGEARGGDGHYDVYLEMGGIFGATSGGSVQSCASFGNTIYGFIYHNGYKKIDDPSTAIFRLGGIGGESYYGTVTDAKYYNNSITYAREYYDHVGWNDSEYAILKTEIKPGVGCGASGDCKEDYTIAIKEFNGHRYMLIPEQLTWEEAKAKCEAMGGHLVTINSAEEQSFVANLALGQYIWLGASDAETEGTWVWVTGEDFAYTNWSVGEPQGAALNEDYALLHASLGGCWVDTTSDQYYFICEWDSSAETEIVFPEFSVVYEENGGTVVTDGSYTALDELVLPTPTKTGYNFAGWYTNAELTGSPVSKIEAGSFGDKTFWAKWELSSYTISFDLNGGSGTIDPQTYLVGAKTSKPATVPTRAGYDFVTWTFKDSDFVYGDVMPNENLVATAVWTFKTVYYESEARETIIDASYEYTKDWIDISSLSPFLTADYKLIFEVSVDLREKAAGYQEMYLCKSDSTHIAGIYEYEHGGSGSANKNWGTANFTWTVSGDSCTSTMLMRYGGHGESGSDDWYLGTTKVSVTVLDSTNKVVMLNGHSYQLFEELLSWEEAKAKCEAMGGHLVTITSAEENEIVRKLVATYGNSLWIGGSDTKTEGSFAWVTGEAFSYTNWSAGEPNNGNGEQDYMAMYTNGCWDDATNSDLGYYICEYEPTVYNKAKEVVFNNSRYQLIEEALTWEEAKAKCEAMGGHLVTISTAEENAIVRALAGRNVVWLGATDAASEGKFVWVTDESFYYTNWRPGDPDNSNGNEHYLQMNVSGTSDYSGLWNDNTGTTTAYYICEWGTTTAYLNGHRYQIFEELLTWEEAQAKCEAMGGHLVTITSAEENAFVHGMAGENTIWLGANDLETEGNFVWVTGEEFTYVNWRDGQPDNANGNEHYVHMNTYSVDYTGTWNDAFGEGAPIGISYYICEWEPDEGPEVVFNGHRYQLIEEKLSWEEAQAKCEAMGGHLVTISSAEENQAVQSLASSGGQAYVWLGCNDLVAEGTFLWVTGESSAYSNWAPGQPDSWDGNQDYMIMVTADGTWDDNGASSLYYICEWEPIAGAEVTYDSGDNAVVITGAQTTLDTLDLSALNAYMTSDYILVFSVEVEMAEVNEGYQEVYLRTENGTTIASHDCYEYGGPGAPQTVASYVPFSWSASGDQCTDTMRLDYGAHGAEVNDWVRYSTIVTVTVLKA